MHASAVRVLFTTLAVPDDGRIFEKKSRSAKSIVTPLLTNPERYAHTVTSLVVRDPDFASACGHQSASCLFSGEQGHDMVDSFRNLRPITAEDLSALLKVCNNLETFAWESSIPPPDGLCEVCVQTPLKHLPVRSHVVICRC